MLNLSVSELEPGMRLAQDITNNSGGILLNAGVELSSRFIEKFRQLGLKTIWVYQKGEIPIEEEEIPPLQNKNRYDSISSETYSSALETVKNIVRDIQLGDLITGEKIEQAITIVGSIVDEITDNRVVLVENLEEHYQPIAAVGEVIKELAHKKSVFDTLDNMRCYDEYTFIHSVNVTTMAITIGLALRYGKEQLKELGLGALLHDIGKIKIPKEIVAKPSTLTSLERREIEKHPQYAFELLSKLADLPPLAVQAVYQHHEKFDGTGYPQRLKGEQIHEYARIIAIADVYDALVSDRCYRPRFQSYEASEIISASSAFNFDLRLVKVFLENIVIYPVGSIVELNTNQRGVVTKINKLMPTRPVVCLFYDEKGRHMPIPKKIDLMRNLTTFITKVFSSEPIWDDMGG